MKKIQISRQQAGKAKQLQSFLHNYWRKNHIFVKNKKFLIWQHKKGSFLTYITAKLKDKIVGVIGYIPQSHYDSKLPKNEIFLTISRTTENIPPAVHLKIFTYIKKKIDKGFIGSLGGWNARVANYNKYLGFITGFMDHYLMASPYLKNYKVINFNKRYLKKKIILKKLIVSNKCEFLELNEKFLKKNKLYDLYKHQYPNKSNKFIINRYLKHPIFKYNVFLLKKNSRPLAILVIRKIKVKNSNVLRIIDFIGKQNEFSNIGNLAIYLFKKYKSEFIDIYSYGINTKYIKKAGFLDRRKISNLIVPDYYEPFLRKNINLMYGYMCRYEKENKLRILKGDGDQDRPNY